MKKVLFACAASRLPKNMEAKHKQFLSEARYTIGAQERRYFADLPPSERDAFIEEFWRKQDPDPATEVNEFKAEYYKSKRIWISRSERSSVGGHYEN